MKQYCMKCGFATAYVNLMPPAKCSKCGLSYNGSIKREEVKRNLGNFQNLPDLDENQVSRISAKGNPFGNYEDDIVATEIREDDTPQESRSFNTAPKRVRVPQNQGEPQIVANDGAPDIDLTTLPKKRGRKKRKDDSAILSILQEGQSAPARIEVK